MNFSIFFWLILINFHIVFYDGDSGAFFACASIVFACQEIRAINHVFFCWNTFMHVTKPFYSSFLMFTCILLFFLTYFYMIFLLFFTSNFGGLLCWTLFYSRCTIACRIPFTCLKYIDLIVENFLLPFNVICLQFLGISTIELPLWLNTMAFIFVTK